MSIDSIGGQTPPPTKPLEGTKKKMRTGQKISTTSRGTKESGPQNKTRAFTPKPQQLKKLENQPPIVKAKKLILSGSPTGMSAVSVKAASPLQKNTTKGSSLATKYPGSSTAKGNEFGKGPVRRTPPKTITQVGTRALASPQPRPTPRVMQATVLKKQNTPIVSKKCIDIITGEVSHVRGGPEISRGSEKRVKDAEINSTQGEYSQAVRYAPIKKGNAAEIAQRKKDFQSKMTKEISWLNEIGPSNYIVRMWAVSYESQKIDQLTGRKKGKVIRYMGERCEHSVSHYIYDTEASSSHPFNLSEEKKSIVIGYYIDVLRGLVDVHKKGIVHRDLKPENLLIKNGIAKLSDFGFACKTGDTRSCGTDGYAAPEVFAESGCSSKSDIFSIGMMLLEIYKNDDFQTVCEAQKTSDGVAEIIAIRDNLPKDTLLAALIYEMINPNPDLRPSTETVLRYLEAIHAGPSLGEQAQLLASLKGEATGSTNPVTGEISYQVPGGFLCQGPIRQVELVHSFPTTGGATDVIRYSPLNGEPDLHQNQLSFDEAMQKEIAWRDEIGPIPSVLRVWKEISTDANGIERTQYMAEKCDSSVLDKIYAVENAGTVDEKFIFDLSAKNKKVVIGYYADVLYGLMSVHDKGIVHGNLKPENVLEKDTYGKIDGFRFAVREGTPGMRNTHGYIPAEFFSGGNFSSKSDIFSVGLMLLEILDNNSFMKVRTAQLNGEDGWKEIHDACLRLPEKDRLSELIRNMLELNPERRPSTNDAFNELLSIYNEM